MIYKIGLFFLLIILTQECQSSLFLSLEKAENVAICNNYEINAALHRLEQGYYGFKASKAVFKPQFDLSSSVDFTQDEHAVDAVVRMSQPLFDKVASYNLKESELQWEKLRMELHEKLCNVLFEVRKAYHTVLLHQEHLTIDRHVITLWDEELKGQERRIELGQAIPFELNQTKLHLKSAWSDFYATQGEVKTSLIRLLTVLGLAPTTSVELTEKEISLVPAEWRTCGADRWKQWAFQYRPQLKQEELSYLLSKNKVYQTRAEKLPTVSFYANAGNRYVNNGFTGQSYVGTGVNIDWMLYDPTNAPRLRQAQEGKKEAASNYFQTELETEAVIHALLNDIEKSYLAYQNAEEGARFAEQGMQMAKRKREVGMMSAFEYSDTIKTLHEAQQQVNRAKYDLRLAYDELIMQTGLDLRPQHES